MTPEEKAREIATEAGKLSRAANWQLVESALEVAIAEALRDARNDALEEAAKVAETCRDEFLSPQYATPQPIGSVAERFACSKVAEAIRSLIKEPTSGGHDG